MAQFWADLLAKEVLGEARFGVLEQKKNVQDELAKLVDRANSQFFKMLATKAVGAPAAPDLGHHTPSDWKILNDTYQRWKARRGYSTNFYSKTNNLRGVLKRTKARSKLGYPQVFYSRGGEAPRSGFSQEGRSFREGSTGRFASRSAATELRPSTIIIEVAPNLRDMEGDEITEAMWGYGSKTFWKLTNPGGQSLRPIMGHYTDWWVGVWVRRIIEKAV